MGFLDFLKGRPRAAAPIPDELWDWAIAEHRIFRGLSEEERGRLRGLAAGFLAAKRFEAVGGAEIDDRLKVSVAAQACLPLLGLDLSWYKQFTTIFITKDAYAVTQRWEDEAGVTHESEEEFAGEAFELGPVALSIPDIDASGWGDGYNVVIHEMAHKLDGLDGAYDGCPPLGRGIDRRRWAEAFGAAYEDLRAKLDAEGRTKRRRGTSKRRARIDPYAAESPDEFFAVACEYFWERPALLKDEYPDVYAQLAAFFRQDPAARP
ncbi:MAG TPA: zinc-dependent peptidase [Treponemataceae bacterium]|nr:zinc-dependent peptidase [Treponemataceae bacterium]